MRSFLPSGVSLCLKPNPCPISSYASPSLLRLTNTHTPYTPNHGHQDLWALGVLAHGLLTGFFPFRSETPRELAEEIGPYGRKIAIQGVSEEGNQFLRILLDPRNEGRVSAGMMLGHPWVAPYVVPEHERMKEGTVKFPIGAGSSSAELVRSAKIAESVLDRLLGPCRGQATPSAHVRRDSGSSAATLCEDSGELQQVGKSKQGKWWEKILGRERVGHA